MRAHCMVCCAVYGMPQVLNSQQLELVNSKSAIEKIVSEFESLREQFIDVYLQVRCPVCVS